MNKEQFTPRIFNGALPFDVFMNGAQWQKSEQPLNAHEWYIKNVGSKIPLLNAAPDMYEALNKIDKYLDSFGGHYPPDGIRAEIKAALNKANPQNKTV